MTVALLATCSKWLRRATFYSPTEPMTAMLFCIAMAERGAWANIRAMPSRVITFPFSPWVCRQRNAVERFFTSELWQPNTTNERDNFPASIQLA